ncbi:hypothetical protein DFH09DRAFT_1368758, partial [Mycena vulgaris]
MLKFTKRPFVLANCRLTAVYSLRLTIVFLTPTCPHDGPLIRTTGQSHSKKPMPSMFYKTWSSDAGSIIESKLSYSRNYASTTPPRVYVFQSRNNGRYIRPLRQHPCDCLPIQLLCCRDDKRFRSLYGQLHDICPELSDLVWNCRSKFRQLHDLCVQLWRTTGRNESSYPPRGPMPTARFESSEHGRQFTSSCLPKNGRIRQLWVALRHSQHRHGSRERPHCLRILTEAELCPRECKILPSWSEYSSPGLSLCKILGCLPTGGTAKLVYLDLYN